jgi:hypothetical protein
MAKITKITKMSTQAARHAIIYPVSEISEMSKMSIWAARHAIIYSLKSSVV